jgi:murein endopeptidase
MFCTGGSVFLLCAALGGAAPDAGGSVQWPDAGLAAEGEEEVDDDDATAEDEDTPDEEEAEAHEVPPSAGPTQNLYTADVSDADLARLWRDHPEELGSISVGFADSGRIINGMQVPPHEAWTVVAPEQAWGVSETVHQLMTTLVAVRAQYPQAPAVRVNHISKKEGGYLRPHQSHQSGRDVDLAFYYRTEVPPGFRGSRERLLDPALNWALLKTLATQTDVQVVLVDRRIQRVLYEHALHAGEDPAWLDSLFHAGARSMVKHARRHRDHFHIRFYAPRAQELGRRVQPLLAQRPDQNIMFYRVRRGDTLGHIAARFGSSVPAIRRANGMRNSFLSLGRVLQVPLRGPCTRCPLPPPMVLPPRRVPPQTNLAADAGVPDAQAAEAVQPDACVLQPAVNQGTGTDRVPPIP